MAPPHWSSWLHCKNCTFIDCIWYALHYYISFSYSRFWLFAFCFRFFSSYFSLCVRKNCIKVWLIVIGREGKQRKSDWERQQTWLIAHDGKRLGPLRFCHVVSFIQFLYICKNLNGTVFCALNQAAPCPYILLQMLKKCRDKNVKWQKEIKLV